MSLALPKQFRRSLNRSLDDFQGRNTRAHVSPTVNRRQNLVRQARQAPHKYDHIHEKTFISGFVPKAVEHEFQFPYMVTAQRLEPLMRISTVRHADITVTPRNMNATGRISLQKRRLRRLKPIKTGGSGLTVSCETPMRTPKPDAAVLCVADGANINSKRLQFCQVDRAALHHRFLGKPNAKIDPELDDIDTSLASMDQQGLHELIEHVSDRLDQQFDIVYRLNGDRVDSLQQIDHTTNVLIFGQERHTFKGLTDE